MCVLAGMRGWGVCCVCWLFYSRETFWMRTTNHKMKALSLISAIYHEDFCFLTHHTNSYLVAKPLIIHHKKAYLWVCFLHKILTYYLFSHHIFYEKYQTGAIRYFKMTDQKWYINICIYCGMLPIRGIRCILQGGNNIYNLIHSFIF